MEEALLGSDSIHPSVAKEREQIPLHSFIQRSFFNQINNLSITQHHCEGTALYLHTLYALHALSNQRSVVFRRGHVQ